MNEPDDALASARRQAELEIAKDRPAKATRALTYVLEELVPIPGTTFRLGVDPFLSLIPGAGQVSGAVFGSVLLFDAARLRRRSEQRAIAARDRSRLRKIASQECARRPGRKLRRHRMHQS